MSEAGQELTEVVRALRPVCSLAPGDQECILDACEVLTLQAGDYLFRQGEQDPFTCYLLDGTLDLVCDGALMRTIAGGSESALDPVAQLKPRKMDARARSPALVLQLPTDLLQALVEDSAGAAPGTELEVAELHEDEGDDWMSRLLATPLFARLPAGHIQRIFGAMQPLACEAGEMVLRQGEAGDAYFVIAQGRCEILRRVSGRPQPVKLGELGAGEAFGEEALISGSPRNADVRMLDDGLLMRIERDEFIEFVSKPALVGVDAAGAQERIKAGWRWLDVRFPEEHRRNPLPGSSNLPVGAIRARLDRLRSDPDFRFVTCCDDGERSAVAAFLLVQHGVEAVYLSGGLDALGRDPAAEPHKPRRGRPAVSEPTQHEPPFDPVLRAELDAARQELRKAREEAERLRHQISSARREAEAEAEVKLREREQQVRVRAEAENRLREEKARLEADFARTAEELTRVQQMRDAAERRLRQEQGALEQRAGETERRLNEALALKAEAEAARKAAIVAMEDSLRSSRDQLEAEGQRAEEALREVERLRTEVEQARDAAQTEAERKRQRELELERFKQDTEARLREEESRLQGESARHEQELARIREEKVEAEARVKAERDALRQESEGAAKRLQEAQRMQEAAEAAREKAEAEARARQERLAEMEQRLKVEAAAAAEAVAKRDEEHQRLEEARDRERQALRQARLERQATADARKAAESRSVRSNAQYRAALKEALAEEQLRLRSEREKLENEAGRIKSLIDEVQRMREQGQPPEADAPDTSRSADEPELTIELLPGVERMHGAPETDSNAPVGAAAASKPADGPRGVPFRRWIEADEDRVLSRDQVAAIRKRLLERVK